MISVALEPDLVLGFVLALVRASAWLVLVPPFGTRAIPSQVKMGLAAALALPAADEVAQTAPGLDVPSLVVAVAQQVAIGLVLGFLTSLVFAAVQAAGSLIDLFGGFEVAQAYDPLSDRQVALFGRFYQVLATTLLFAIDGHLLLVRGFLRSFEAVGADALSADGLAQLVTSGVGTFMVAALEIAAPLLAALFLAELGMGLLARAAPQLNLLALGFPLKILLTLGLIGLSLPVLPGAVRSLLDQVGATVGTVAW